MVCFLFIQTGRKIERERERADSVSWPGIKPLPTRWNSRAAISKTTPPLLLPPPPLLHLDSWRRAKKKPSGSNGRGLLAGYPGFGKSVCSSGVWLPGN